jgi:CheB methylesterase/CheR methyltransferase, all-alpha domain
LEEAMAEPNWLGQSPGRHGFRLECFLAQRPENWHGQANGNADNRRLCDLISRDVPIRRRSFRIGSRWTKRPTPARISTRDELDETGSVTPTIERMPHRGEPAPLDAFKSFFANTLADTGMAFVLVQHLSPDHKSMLVELLAKSTAMSVIGAADYMEVNANCVFIIPPDSTLTIQGGRLRITRPAPPRDSRRPIDTFFKSLAEDQGENAVGIVLAGTGSDGSLGLANIKERGGLTLAQAEFDHHALPGMPMSATVTGQVDDVLAVEAMPARLAAHQQHLLGVAPSKDNDGARRDAGSQLMTIIAALRARSGYDFSEYKENTLVRRLQRRMQVLRVDNPQDYIERYITASKKSLAKGRLCASSRNGKTFASQPRATARLKFSLGDVSASAAQASTPNSRARKIELVALPHPRSRIRIAALKRKPVRETFRLA